MYCSKDITSAEARQFLSDLARHVPLGMDLGKPVVMTADGSLLLDADEPALLAFSPSGDGVWRTVELGPGEFELTKWSAGIETAREIVHGDLFEGIRDGG